MQPEAASRRYNRAPAQTLQALHIPEALLKIQTVTAVTGLSESTIRRKVTDGKFPAPVKDGARCTRWVAASVSNWLRAKAVQ
nr:AlpA family phage regulatory protein [Variovorax boronicumulans]